MSDPPASLFAGDAPSASQNNDVASVVKIPSTPDPPLPDVGSSVSELGDLALAVQLVAHTAIVAHDAELAASRAIQAAKVEALVAKKARKAATALIARHLEAFVESFREELKKRGVSIDQLGDNPCTWHAVKLLLSKDEDEDEPPAVASKGVLSLPFEVVGEIGSQMSVTDLSKMRLVNKSINKAVAFPYGKKISVTENVIIYPTFASVGAFLIGLGLNEAYPQTVRTITLIGEGPAAPEFSYSHSWDYLPKLKFPGMPEPTEDQWYEDAEILEFANDEHEHWNQVNESFCYTGAYRTMLSLLLAKLPNLKTIRTRKLYPGEHIPGWAGPEALKEVSSYHPWTPVNTIYYGDWKYDEKHKRVTMWTDEYGEDMEEEDVGPQVGFKEDLAAAMLLSGTEAQVFEMHKELV